MQNCWDYLRALGRPPIQFSILFSNSFSIRGGARVGDVMGEVTKVHVTNIFVGVDFVDVDFGNFFNNFCGCGRFLNGKKGVRGYDM